MSRQTKQETDNCQLDINELAIIRAAIENTNEAFVTIDQNHKVHFFNRAAEKMFGYSREEILGKDLDLIMAPTCSRNHRKAVEQYKAAGAPKRIKHIADLIATRKNGEAFPANISFSVSPVQDEIFFTGIIRDLTETNLLREQMKKNERLASLGQFVAEIIHEIKTPLMMIGGFTLQMIRQAQDSKSIKKLNIIHGEVERLEELLRELREFYFPGDMENKDTDIDDLLNEVYSLVKHDCNEKSIHVKLLAESNHTRIDGDRNKLKQVMLNLIKNANDAMKHGGNLTIRSQVRNGYVDVTIGDDGCGIPEENKEKLFSPFFSTKKHGTGLGLSITKRIIEDHKGASIHVASRRQRGTICKLSFPINSEKGSYS